MRSAWWAAASAVSRAARRSVAFDAASSREVSASAAAPVSWSVDTLEVRTR